MKRAIFVCVLVILMICGCVTAMALYAAGRRSYGDLKHELQCGRLSRCYDRSVEKVKPFPLKGR